MVGVAVCGLGFGFGWEKGMLVGGLRFCCFFCGDRVEEDVALEDRNLELIFKDLQASWSELSVVSVYKW